jgi:hypothetical protein
MLKDAKYQLLNLVCDMLAISHYKIGQTHHSFYPSVYDRSEN